MEQQILICNEPSPKSPSPPTSTTTATAHNGDGRITSSNTSHNHIFNRKLLIHNRQQQSLPPKQRSYMTLLESSPSSSTSSSSSTTSTSNTTLSPIVSSESESSGYDSNNSFISSVHSNSEDDYDYYDDGYDDDDEFDENLYKFNENYLLPQEKYEKIRHRKMFLYEKNNDHCPTLSSSSPSSTSSSSSSSASIKIMDEILDLDQYQRRQQQEQQLSTSILPMVTMGIWDQHLLDDSQKILQLMLSIEHIYIPWNVVENVYNSSKHEINEKIRHELTEWMFEVCEAFKCQEGIFPLSVNYLDRFLLTMSSLPKSQLQLIGIVCLLIASKIHQCHSLDANYLSYTTEYAYTVREILTWEQVILNHLKWDVSSIVATDFLDYILVIVSKFLQSQNANNTDDNKVTSCINKRKTSLKYDEEETEEYGTKRFKVDHQQQQQNYSNYDHLLNGQKHEKEVDDKEQDKNEREGNNEQVRQPLNPIVSTIRRHANTFITICSTELSFVCVKPSIIATACVATAIRGLMCTSHGDHNQQQQKPAKQNSHQQPSSEKVQEQTQARVGGVGGIGEKGKKSLCVPKNLYDNFLLNVQKQTGIDPDQIESYARLIEQLTVSKLENCDINPPTSSNSSDSDSSSTKPMLSCEQHAVGNSNHNSNMATTITITTANINTNNNNNRSSSSSPDVLYGRENGGYDDQCKPSHQPYNYQHSNNSTTIIIGTDNIQNEPQMNVDYDDGDGDGNYHPQHYQPQQQRQHQQQYYIHTTFPQVSNAKQLLLLCPQSQTSQQYQQQQLQQLRQHPNQTIQTTNIPFSLLQDSTNNNSSSNGGLNDNHQNDHHDGSSAGLFKSSQSVTTPTTTTTMMSNIDDISNDFLLAYLETIEEDRENIEPRTVSLTSSFFLMDQQIGSSIEHQENQENIPPSSHNITSIEDIDPNDPNEDDLDDHFYF